MGIVLAVYSLSAFQEFYLPALVNDEYSITIDSDVFRIPKSIVLHFENIDSVWFFSHNNRLVYSDEGDYAKRRQLKAGDILKIGASRRETWASIIVSERTHSIRSFSKHPVTIGQTVSIGRRAENTIQYDFLNLVGNFHATISKTSSECVITDNSRNGVFISGKRIEQSAMLSFGDTINIFGLCIVYLGDFLAIDCQANGVALHFEYIPATDVPRAKPGSKTIGSVSTKPLYFKRSPRSIGALHEDPIEIEAPPPLAQTKQQPLILTIGPAITMVIPMMLGSFIMMAAGANSTMRYVGIAVAGASGFFAVMWSLIRIRHGKNEAKKEALFRQEQYSGYLGRIEDELRKETTFNASTLCRRYPSAMECTSFSKKRQRLWNRNSSHPDFLYVRLGVGELPFQAPILVPKERFSLTDDALAEQPRILRDTYSILKDVPVGVDLAQKHLIGVFGTSGKARILQVVRDIVMQLAANNCYTDLKMVFLYGEDERERWTYARWLPHVWSDNRETRYIADDKASASDMLYALADVLRGRSEQLSSRESREHVFQPHFVVFISDPMLLENEPIAKFLMNPFENLGVTTILLSESYSELPNRCVDIIQADDHFCGIYDVRISNSTKVEIAFDTADDSSCERFARQLACIRVNDPGNEGEFVDSLSFVDMYGVSTLAQLEIAERWRRNRTYDNLRALIGQKAGGTDVYLDIHEKYHGPHGLVAGTTGSGKSETLQTFILSLAVNFSPRDVGFLIIDFKGGGMANLFSNLPHMVGTISNLSGNQVRRAMTSIQSEIRRRQRIFGEYGVNHLDAYTQLFKSADADIPLPHLLIIIDEFAELKKEEPDFMRELISVAQVGRSLGIHLILATQKPAGVVDDNIWSNARFRLCLRVQDRQDSMDMIRKPDAVSIVQAGRAYLQVGNDEIYEMFQSGWSGAPYDEETTGTHTQTAAIITITGKLIEGKKRKREMSEARRISWIGSLLSIIRHSVELLGVNDVFALEDSSLMEQLLNEVFVRIQRDKIEYADMPANRDRMQGLIRLALMVLSDTEAADEDTADISSTVLMRGLQEGIRLPEEKKQTQLTALVEYIACTAKAAQLDHVMQLWLPMLPDTLLLQSIQDTKAGVFDGKQWPEPTSRWSLSTVIGLFDDPAHQSQFPAIVDFAKHGNIAVCGMTMSGKSTFMQTMLYGLCQKYSPASVNIFILDFSSKMLLPFENAPHVGGVISEGEVDKTAMFLAMLAAELDRRKAVFKGGTYAQYVQANGVIEPSILCVIDGYAVFRELTDNAYEREIITLCTQGPGNGIFFAIASGGFGANEIQARIADNIKAVFSLEMGDKFKYIDALKTTHIGVLPESGIKGRGLAISGEAVLEFQTALCTSAENDYERADAINALLCGMRAAWVGKPAKTIPMIPEKPTWQTLSAVDGFQEACQSDNQLPIGYAARDASLFSLDLSRVFTYMIVGKAYSGKSNAITVCARSAAAKGAQGVIIDSPIGALETLANELRLEYASTDEDFVRFGNELLQEIGKRNKRKQDMRAEGLSQAQIQRQMQKEFVRYCVFIDDLGDFVQRIYLRKPGMQDISGFLENVIEKGEQHNLYFFVAISAGDYGKLIGRKVFDGICSRKTGMLLSGKPSEQKFFDFAGLSYQEQTSVLPQGTALIASEASGTTPRVVIPVCE